MSFAKKINGILKDFIRMWLKDKIDTRKKMFEINLWKLTEVWSDHMSYEL